MQQPAARSVVRNFQSAPLNHHTKDHITESGVRISTPIYIDLTTSQRKELLNAIRSKCSEPIEVVSGQSNVSGNRTLSYSSAQPGIESYIGMSLEVLRNVIFQRGGLDVALVLRLQSVSGSEFVTTKEIAAASKGKVDLAKKYTTDFAYQPVTANQ